MAGNVLFGLWTLEWSLLSLCSTGPIQVIQRSWEGLRHSQSGLNLWQIKQSNSNKLSTGLLLRVFLPRLILVPNFNKYCQIWQDAYANIHLPFVSKFQLPPSVSGDAKVTSLSSCENLMFQAPLIYTRTNLRPERKRQVYLYTKTMNRCKIEDRAVSWNIYKKRVQFLHCPSKVNIRIRWVS